MTRACTACLTPIIRHWPYRECPSCTFRAEQRRIQLRRLSMPVFPEPPENREVTP